MNRYEMIDAMFNLVENNTKEILRDKCLDAIDDEYENLGDIYTSRDMYENAIEAIKKVFDNE